MKTLRFHFLLAACFGWQTLAVYAWHDRGHEVVAEIAWEQMTPQARAASMALLQSAPADAGIAALRPTTGTAEEQDRTQFIRAAVWADAIRNGPRKARYHQALWHFTDFFWEQPTTELPPRQRPDVLPHGDLVTKLRALEASLRAPAEPAVSPSKATDLAWFLHLMGDIAQPLHCSGRITASEPTGDEGGNLFFLSARAMSRPTTSALGPSGSQRPPNLHFYWDHVIEREFGESADARQVAAEIVARYPRKPALNLRLGEYEHWARTSQRIAMRVAYPATLVRFAEPSAAYRKNVLRVSERVMALAGYRLGETLNAVFAAP